MYAVYTARVPAAAGRARDWLIIVYAWRVLTENNVNYLPDENSSFILVSRYMNYNHGHLLSWNTYMKMKNG